MPLEVTKLERKFFFTKDGKDINLPDIGAEFTVQEVLKFYSSQYPEITNAIAEGPIVQKDKAVYKVTTKAGKLG